MRMKSQAAVHAYLHKVANAYRRAGYGKFARELRKSEALFEAIAESDAAGASENLPAARRALRRLTFALNKNDFIAVPTQAGRRLPNYFLIAASFVLDSNRALQNLTAGKSATRGLKAAKGADWVTNLDGETVELSSSSRGTPVASANPYTGSATVDSGTLQMSESGFTSLGFTSSGFSFDMSGATAGSGVSFVDFTKTGSGTLTLNYSSTYNGVTTISDGWLTDNTADGSALSQVLLQGGSLRISGFTSALLAVTPPIGTPSDITEDAFLTLSQDCTVDGIDFPSGTQFFKVADDYAAPEGTTLLPAGPLTATPVATPTPTPSPTP
jgi:autotransporter-associated beta strand protein